VLRQQFQRPPALGLLGVGEAECRGADRDKRGDPVRMFEGEIQRQIAARGERDEMKRGQLCRRGQQGQHALPGRLRFDRQIGR
jgi:hypothetical protein